MIDVTELMQRYRHVVLAIWNQGLWREPRLRDSRTWYYFKDVRELLFDAMVYIQLAELSGVADPDDMVSQFPLLVVPRDKTSVPVMISRPGPRGESGMWDDPVRMISAEGTRLRFIEYFDWDQDNYISFQYYLVTIETFGEHPEVEGRQALLDVQHCNVFFPGPLAAVATPVADET